MTARRRMTTRAAVLGGCFLAVLAVGCKEAGRSNVRLHLSAGAGVTGLTSVAVTATQGTREVKQATFDWPSGATSLEAGLLVPAEVSGEISVAATGRASSQDIARSEAVKVTVTPGQATTEMLQLLLLPIPPSTSDGGADAGGLVDAAVDMGADTRSDVGGGTGGRVDGGTDAPPIVARAWQSAVKAENNIDEQDLRPAVAIDASGNAIAVWEHGTQIWFNRYNAATGLWGTEAPVVVAGGQGVSVGLDAQGTATVTWQGAPLSADQGILAVTSTAGGGWGTPVRLSSSNAADVHLAVSANGTAVAVWTENNHVRPSSNEYILWSSRRLAGSTTWSAKTMIRDATDIGDRTPTVALDATGNGFVIWEQPPIQPDPGNDFNNSVWIARFAGGAFGTPMTIETFTTGAADSGHVAVNASGNGVASWRQITTTALELWTRTYENGAWGTPTLISTSSLIDYYQVPEVAIDNAGNSVVVWSQAIASGAFNARISRHRAGQATWDAPMMLELDNQSQGTPGTDDVSPEVGMDSAGNAVVIWRKTGTNGLTNVWSRRMDATGVLGAATRIDNQNLHSAFAHALAVSANGMAVAVWYYGSEFDIWANVFR
ncbi:MAG TPA: hypothetical protein VFH68_13990 [Polyangia bacterium]|nr:hypothetical protein [Polyangia bacterium]